MTHIQCYNGKGFRKVNLKLLPNNCFMLMNYVYDHSKKLDLGILN